MVGLCLVLVSSGPVMVVEGHHVFSSFVLQSAQSIGYIRTFTLQISEKPNNFKFICFSSKIVQLNQLV